MKIFKFLLFEVARNTAPAVEQPEGVGKKHKQAWCLIYSEVLESAWNFKQFNDSLLSYFG